LIFIAELARLGWVASLLLVPLFVSQVRPWSLLLEDPVLHFTTSYNYTSSIAYLTPRCKLMYGSIILHVDSTRTWQKVHVLPWHEAKYSSDLFPILCNYMHASVITGRCRIDLSIIGVVKS
jgi:hypothetical protein